MNAMVQFLMNIVGDTYVSLLPSSSFHAGSPQVSPQIQVGAAIDRDESLPDPEGSRRRLRCQRRLLHP